MTTSSKQKARSRLVQARAAAAAERARAERQNIDDLAEFVCQVGKADEVDAWLDARIQKLRQQADARQHRHRVAAGKALAVLRSRGESVASLAEQAGITAPKVREYLKLAATDEATETDAAPALEQEPSDTTAAAPDRDHQELDVVASTRVGAAS